MFNNNNRIVYCFVFTRFPSFFLRIIHFNLKIVFSKWTLSRVIVKSTRLTIDIKTKLETALSHVLFSLKKNFFFALEFFFAISIRLLKFIVDGIKLNKRKKCADFFLYNDESAFRFSVQENLIYFTSLFREINLLRHLVLVSVTYCNLFILCVLFLCRAIVVRLTR